MLRELKTKMLKQGIQYKQDSLEISQLCRDLAKFVEKKCWAKLTWYHFAAAFLHPVYREHDSLKSNSIEQELDRVRLDMKRMLASLEDKAFGAPPKRRAEQCCFLTAMMILTKKLTKSRILPQLLVKSMLIPLQISTLRTGTTDLWLSGSRIALASRNCMAVIARSVYSTPASQNKSERAFSAARHVMTENLDPEHLDELLLLRSFNKLKGSIA